MNPPLDNPRAAFRRKAWLRAVAVAALLLAACAAFFWVDEWAAWHSRTTLYEASRGDWFRAFRKLGKFSPPVWLFLLWAWAGKRGGNDRRFMIAATGLAAALLVAPPVHTLKFLTDRPRPHEVFKDHAPSSGVSFPSGDAGHAFAMAAALASLAGPRWGAVGYAAAGAIAALRVLHSSHYPSDVLVGAALGLLAGWLALHFGRRRFAKAPRWWRRSGWGFWALWILPLGDSLAGHDMLRFFNGFGPLVAGALVLAKGRAWLRWLGPAGSDEGEGRRATWGLATGGRARAAAWVLAGVLALFILPALGWPSLYDRDEGYYAECARHMSITGDVLVPHFSGEPWMEKPPLTYWFMALAMRLFGADEFAARLPSGLFGVLAALMAFQLARRMGSLRAAALAAAALASAPLFGIVARLALLDAALLCCVMLSMIGLWRFVQGRSEGLGLLMFYSGAGLGMLAKGPLGAALPVFALAGYLALSGEWKMLKRMRLVPGGCLALAIFAAWAVPANMATDGEFFRELVWRRTLRPVIVPLQGHGGGSPLMYLLTVPFYVPVLAAGFLPWTLFWWPSAKDMLRRGRKDPRFAFLGGWFLVHFAAFSLVRTKLPHHILPALPPLAIAMGLYFDKLWRGEAGGAPKAPRACRWMLLGIGVAGAAGMLALGPVLGFGWETVVASLPVALAAGASGWAPALRLRLRPAHAAVPMAVWSMLWVTLAWQFGLPSLDRAKAPQRIVRSLTASHGPGMPGLRLGVSGFREVSLAFYARRPLHRLRVGEELDAFLAKDGPAAAVLSDRHFRAAKEAGLPEDHQILFDDKVWLPEKGRWERVVVVGNGRK